MRIPSTSYSALGVIAGVALCAFSSPRGATAGWPPFGRAICSARGGQVHSVIATDGTGGAIIAWQDPRSRKINIFARRVLASGELDASWPVDGRALLTDSLALANADAGQTTPALVADGSGGAIVAWQDNRSPVTETDIFAQHVLASGAVDTNWKPNGTALVEIEGVQNTFVMVSDGAGGAIVTWMDSRPGATDKDIYAQHVLASGQVDLRWPEDGVAVNVSSGLQEFPGIVPDGAGGAIIAWDDARSSTTSVDVYAQHVLNSGALDRAWPADGRALCTAPGGQGHVTIVSDGAGGAVVAWSDSRIVGTSHIFAQHVFATGTVDPAWPVNGRGLSDAGVLETRPLAVSDNAGGAIVTWQAFTIHLNMFAQHVKGAAVVDPAWPAGGRALSLTDRQQTFADIATDGSGGAIVAWADNSDIFAQHVLASGALDSTYPDTGRAVCNLPSSQGDVALVATGLGGAIASWTDGRSGIDADIYAMQVLEAVTTGVPAPDPPGLAFAHPGPNPALGSARFQFSLPRETPVRLSIFDVRGRRVRDLVSGTRSAGEHAIAWDLRDGSGRAVGAGIYFARLEAGGHSLTEKIVTVK